MARMSVALSEDVYRANATLSIPGILFLFFMVAATISIMAVVIFNCGDSGGAPRQKKRKGLDGHDHIGK
ncbi:unnamed protein product, partial [Musa hybrid cultivar]